MITNIQSIGFTASEELITFINERTAKLGHYLESILSSEVCLSTDKSDTKENKVCDIRLVIPGNDLLASAQCKSFEEATTKAADALMKQIEKHKTKLYSKRASTDVVEEA
jgi:putative sigma-54 modulation protein